MKSYRTFLSIAAAAFLLLISYARAAEADLEKIERNLPNLLGASNQGLEFVLGFFPTWVENAPNGAQVGIRLYFSSATAAHVTVRVVSKGWEKNLQTVPNQVSEVFIPYEIAQAAGKKLSTEEPEPAQVYPGGAVTVTATAPIVCYGVVRYPYTADGYLAIPVTSLGKEYVVAGYNGPNNEPDQAGQYLTSYTAIVGAYDNTNVRFVYGGRANGWVPTLEGKKLTPGQEDTKILNKGDVWLVPARGNKPDITGSYVEANKPVACFSGNFCANVPVQTPACDLVLEQDMPMHAWGRKYFVSPIKDRAFNAIVRLFASKDNVSIYRNGWDEQVAAIAKKFGPEGEGWVEMRAAEGKAQAVTFLSHDRFNVVQYNPGAVDDGSGADPFEMSLTPVEQFQDHIAFNTPGVSFGMSFKHNFVNIIYKTTAQGKIPDDLEIGAADAQGAIAWEKVSDRYGAEPGFEFIDPTNPTPERKYYCKQIELPGDGVYHVRGHDKFAAYAYGYFYYDSYGFPTSFATMNQGSSDLVKPELDFTVNGNGEVRASSDNSLPAIVSDPNLGLIYFDSENSYNYSFELKPFVAGVDARAEWSLAPLDAMKDARAVITFTDRNGNDTTVVIDHKASLDAREQNSSNIGKVAPNPIDARGGTIEFEIDNDGNVELNLYNSANQLSAVLLNGWLKAGKHSVRIPVESLPGGAYTYRISAGGRYSVQTLIISK